MWLSTENNEPTVYFECKVIETQTVVIGGGAYVKLHKIVNKNKKEVLNEQKENENGNSASFACEKIFFELDMKMQKNPELAKSINKNFAFRITRQNEIKLFSKILHFNIYLLSY